MLLPSPQAGPSCNFLHSLYLAIYAWTTKLDEKCNYNSIVSENNMPYLMRVWFSAFRCCYCSQVRTGRSRTGDRSEQGGLQQLTKVRHISSPKISPRLALNFSFHIPYKKSRRTYFKETVCTRVLGTWNTITAKLGFQAIQETTRQPNQTS